MKSDPHFKQPNGIKSKKPPCKPQDGKPSMWDYRCPEYDQRSSVWVNAGTNYGVAMRQPVGHEGNPKVKVIPTGRAPTIDTDEVA